MDLYGRNDINAQLECQSFILAAVQRGWAPQVPQKRGLLPLIETLERSGPITTSPLAKNKNSPCPLASSSDEDSSPDFQDIPFMDLLNYAGGLAHRAAPDCGDAAAFAGPHYIQAMNCARRIQLS